MNQRYRRKLGYESVYRNSTMKGGFQNPHEQSKITWSHNTYPTPRDKPLTWKERQRKQRL
jgi:hypothetical protein